MKSVFQKNWISMIVAIVLVTCFLGSKGKHELLPENVIFGHGYHLDYLDEHFYTFEVSLAKHMFGKTLADLVQARDHLIQTCRRTYRDSHAPKLNLIPHITHRVWLTKSDQPFEVPFYALEAYFRSIRMLKSGNWRHYFWCVDPSKIPQTIAKIQASGLPIEVHTVSEIEPAMAARHIYNAYLGQNLIAFASDILRANIINQIGGLYSDIGVEFLNDFTDITDKYEYIFLLRGDGKIDIGFYGASPKSHLLQSYLNTLDHLYLLPQNIQVLTNSPLRSIVWTTLGYIMTLIDSILAKDTKILFVQNDSLIRINSLGSWREDFKFGNRCPDRVKIDLFSIWPSVFIGIKMQP